MKYKVGDDVCWLNGGCVEEGYVFEIIDEYSVYCKEHSRPDTKVYCRNSDLFDESMANYRKDAWKDNYDSHVTRW